MLTLASVSNLRVVEIRPAPLSYYNIIFNYATKDSVGTALRRPLRRLGLKGKYRLHDLRHCFITDLVTNGFDIRTIMQIAGHKDMRTSIQRYTHPTFEHKKKAVKMLESKTSYLKESSG